MQNNENNHPFFRFFVFFVAEPDRSERISKQFRTFTAPDAL
jgi:hypothetical protein